MRRMQTEAKPILKWAGGKRQLLPTFTKYLPKRLLAMEEFRYVEPFVGGGAMFFYLLQSYNIKSAAIFDVNNDLVDLYTAVKERSEALISFLHDLHCK